MNTYFLEGRFETIQFWE